MENSQIGIIREVTDWYLILAITGTTPQELSCCRLTAKIVTVPPGGFKVSRSQFNMKSED